MADIVIYGVPASPYVRKVFALCLEKGIEFDLEPASPLDMPEGFSEISPLRRIPAMRDRSIGSEGADGTIADSSAICAYLEKKHPTPALYPDAPYEHGRALWFEEYGDSAIVALTGGEIFRPIFFNLVRGEAPDLQTARAAWNDKLPRFLSYLDQQLEGREFLVGDQFSIADITIACSIMQAELVASITLDNWPSLAAHYAAMKARPSIAGPFAKADGFLRKAMPDRVNLG